MGLCRYPTCTADAKTTQGFCLRHAMIARSGNKDVLKYALPADGTLQEEITIAAAGLVKLGYVPGKASMMATGAAITGMTADKIIGAALRASHSQPTASPRRAPIAVAVPPREFREKDSNMATCVIPGCPKKAESRGCCLSHYAARKSESETGDQVRKLMLPSQRGGPPKQSVAAAESPARAVPIAVRPQAPVEALPDSVRVVAASYRVAVFFGQALAAFLAARERSNP
jgi:hypothetical protein